MSAPAQGVDRETIRTWFKLQYGTDKGTAWIGTNQASRRENPFAYPQQLEEMVEFVATQNEAGYEVWFAAHLSYSKASKNDGGQGRKMGMSVKRRRLHVDIDRALTAEDTTKLRDLDAWVVYSGSPGHVHVYVELARSIDVGLYHALEDQLREYFDADKAVCRDNGLLRIPGTINRKPGAGPVTWDGAVSATKWTNQELFSVMPRKAERKIVAPTVEREEPVRAEPITQPLPLVVRKVLDNPKLKKDSNAIDRSETLAALYNAAASAGLTIEQTLGIALSRTELASKGENWLRTDIARVWTKFGGDSLGEEEHRKRMQDKENDAALMGGQPDVLATKESSLAAPTRTRVVARRATEMDPPKASHWLARGRIPRGDVTVLIGDEGIGKSLFWVWLIAAITNGTTCPMFGIPPRAPADVVIVITEDNWSKEVQPRLIVAGVDLTHVICISENTDGSGTPVFPDDMAAIPTENVALVVVDAWLDTVPGKVSMKDPQQARAALRPWKELATQTGITPLLLMHTNRVSSSSARDKYGISGEVRKIARMTLFAQLDDDGTLTVGPEKHNTTGAVKASMFKLDTRQFRPATDDDDGLVAYLTLTGDSERTAREQIAATYESATATTEAKDCKTWLSNYLDDNLGQAPQTDIDRAARAQKFTDYALRAAKNALHIGVEQRVGEDGKRRWWWVRST